MGELIEFPGKKKPDQSEPEMAEVPKDWKEALEAERRRRGMKAIEAMSEVPDKWLKDTKKDS